MALTLSKEAWDDFLRMRRDSAYNSEVFEVLTSAGKKKKRSGALKVGDIVFIKSGQRIPADMVLLYSR